MFQFERVLEENEQILWTGQPQFKLWIIDKITLLAIIGLFGLLMVLMPIIGALVNPENVSDFSLPILWGVGLACQAPLAWVYFKSSRDHQKTAYAITTKRLLFQNPGRRGSFDMVSIPFSEIKDMQLNQGVIDLFFGGKTKSVLFATADSHINRGGRYGWEYQPKRFEHVEGAEEVLRVYESQHPQSGTVSAATPLVAPAAPLIPSNSQPTFLPQPTALLSSTELESIPADISSILKPAEKVMWHGRPKPRPFILHYFALHVGLLLYFGFVAWSFISEPNQFWQSLDEDSIQILLGYLFLLIAPFIYRLMVYSHVYYVVTDHRVLVQSGAVGTDIEAFERDQITDVSVTSGFLDWMLGDGSATVVLETYNRRNSSKQSLWWKGNELQHIENAGLVQELLRPTSAIVADRAEASFVPLANGE